MKRPAVAGLAAVLVWAASASAGPVFDGVSAPSLGASATVTHKGDGDSTPSASATFSNVAPFVGSHYDIDAAPSTSYSATLFGGADSSGGVGGIGHYTDSTITGYATAAFPSTMGASQTRGGGSFTVGASSSLKNTFNLKWDVDATTWAAPLFAYQLFPLTFTFAGPGDSASFVGNFTYEIDDGPTPNNVIDTTRTITISVSKSFNVDGASSFVTAYAFAYLRGTNVPAGSRVRIKGDITMTALDPSGNASVELHDQITDPGLQGQMDSYGLPLFLRDKRAGGTFAGNQAAEHTVFCAPGVACNISPITPEPATGLVLLLGGTAVLVLRRR